VSHPEDELLADVALGIDELAPETRQHLEHCDECARTVAELRRTVSLVAGSAAAIPTPDAWEAPPPRVWQRIATATAADTMPDTTPDTMPDTMRGRPAAKSDSPVVPLTAYRAGQPSARPRRVWPWAAGMAAAGLAVGLLTGRSFWDGSAPPTATVAQVQLGTLDTQQRLGEAALVRTDSGVNLQIATSTALDPGDGYLEVWLINSDGKRMVSVGVLDAESGIFPVSQTLLDQGYVIVDISREPFDDQPAHSGDSLVRGTLPA
jgi:hypothetical protein